MNENRGRGRQPINGQPINGKAEKEEEKAETTRPAAPSPVAPCPPAPAGLNGLTPNDGAPAGRGNLRGSLRGEETATAVRARRRRLMPGQLLPTRPSPTTVKTGSEGTTIRLRANLFQVNMPTLAFYQYQVDFHPELTLNAADRQRVLQLHKPVLGTYIDANRNIFLLQRIDDHENQVGLTAPDGDVVHSLTLRFVREYTLAGVLESAAAEGAGASTGASAGASAGTETASRAGPSTAIFGIMGRLLNSMMLDSGFQRVRDRFYDTQPSNMTDGRLLTQLQRYGISLYPGYETSMHMHDTGHVYLSVSSCLRVEHTGNVLSALAIPNGPVPDDQMNHIRREVLGERVQTLYGKSKMYKVDDIKFNVNLESETFMLTENGRQRQTNVRQYFNERYGIELPKMTPLLLLARPSSRDRNRQRSEQIDEDQWLSLPPQLVKLTGLPLRCRDDRDFMRSFTGFSRHCPDEISNRLNSFMESFQQRQDVRDRLRDYNWVMAQRPVEFGARVLPQEKIFMGDAAGRLVPVNVDRANPDWSREFRKYRLKMSVPLDKWLVLSDERNEPCVRSFMMAIRRVYEGLGIPIARPDCVKVSGFRPTTQMYQQAVKDEIARVQYQIIVVILPGPKTDTIESKKIYDSIKTLLTVPSNAIPSQFVRNGNISGGFGRGRGRSAGGSSEMNMSVATKIGLQMQAKLGGILWGSSIPPKFSAIVMGYDVSHDTLTKRSSIAAMVATFNASERISGGLGERYYSKATVLNSSSELVTCLSPFVKFAIDKYRAGNGNQFPKKLIVYRDGISDGQVPQVKTVEVEAIKAALHAYSPDTQLMFVICKKSSMMRFFHVYDEADRQNGVPVQMPRSRAGQLPPTVSPGQALNPPPGTVVDSTITRPEVYDFYLVPQSVNQGTVMPCCYNVIHDDTMGAFPAERIQQLTYKLCHQYYNWSGTIRVPSVCQYAHKLAFLIGENIHDNPNDSLNGQLYYL